MNSRKILVVDDEQNICQLVGMYLQTNGYEWKSANDGIEALEKLATEMFDLVILDIMMPNLDGWTVCRKIRETSQIPVIFLSAKGEEWDKVNGLKMGADDYIIKPFSPGELIARVDAVLRRSSGNQEPSNNILQVGTIRINKSARTVSVLENPINLTLKEYDLLLYLCHHQGQVFTREQILEQVWGYDYFGTARTVDTHIKTLRLKLGKDADYISTVWGVGYKFGVQV
jgi:DNA-binding response OmpR family regulator